MDDSEKTEVKTTTPQKGKESIIEVLEGLGFNIKDPKTANNLISQIQSQQEKIRETERKETELSEVKKSL